MIYDIDANCQNFPESFSLLTENGIKAQYKFSFIGHYRNGSKSTKYQSYIKPNNHYWLKVSVTKNTPLELLREIPWKISFPSLLRYFWLDATAAQSITKEQKEKSKAKKPKKIKMSIDMLQNLQIRTCVLARCLEHGHRKRRLPDRSPKYLTDLGKRIKKEGLKEPIILAKFL